MNKRLYSIGDKVFHITPESDQGVVIDASYSLANDRWLYQVTFSPHAESLWYSDCELQLSKTF